MEFDSIGCGAVCCSCCGAGLLPGAPTEACGDRAKPALGLPRCLQEHNSSQIGEVLGGGPVEEDKFCPFTLEPAVLLPASPATLHHLAWVGACPNS